MENNNSFDKIIQKCIDISCIEKKNLRNNSFSFGWMNSITNWKDNLKYNYIRFNNTKFEMIPTNIHLFNKKYNTQNEQEKFKFYQKFAKIIMVSYRSKYKPQTNYKNNKEYTSDCGWGCMIRSSQMIICRALYKIFKYNLKEKEKNNLTKIIIPFIMDNNLILNENEYPQMNNYINKLKAFGKDDIVEIDPPFSIHKICILGEKFGRACGEWFSDFELPKIYDIINSIFDILPNVSIIHFNSVIRLKTILDRCFKEDTTNKENNINNNFDNDINTIHNENEIRFEGKKYIFEKMGLIFVTVRLGLNKVSLDYIPSLKKVFNYKECIGIIGGKKNSNSASYFFGYYENNLLYLDPHHNYPSIQKLDNENINTYINKTIYKLKFTSLKGGLTIVFLFRNFKEFIELLSFIKSEKNEQFPCFDYSEKMVDNDIEKVNSIMSEMTNKDDF